MKSLVAFCWICIALVDSALAQCNFQVNAGPDKFVCNPGESVILEGRITGSPTEFYWEPATNLNNSRILMPRATVFGPTTYYLVARGLDNTNLINNGDFSAGNTGFYTDYALGSTPCYGFGYLDCEGTYDVITNPQLGHSAWSACGDHTTGSGNMMVLNGAPSFQSVWCQQVTVIPDMDYKFSAWCASVTSASPPILQISVNGTTVGNIFNSSGAPCNWEQFGADFNSGPNTIIEICILNMNTNTGGNDFAIDDLVLRKICEVRDTVELDVIQIVAEIETPEEVNCDRTVLELDASGSSQGPGWTYQWTASPGKILSGDKTLKPTIDGPGTYNLTVCSPLPNCCKTVTVMVNGNTTPPNISLSTKDTIGCGKNLAWIRTSTNNFNVTYSWSGPNGFNSEDKDPFVADGGWYIVTVTDEYNCKRIDSIRIIESVDNPKIDIQFNHINCKFDSTRLKAQSSIANSKFEWFGPNNFNFTGDSMVSPDSGWFILKTSTPSGCIRFDSIRVLKDMDKPKAIFSLDSIDCIKDTATLKLLSFGSSDSLFISGPTGFYQLDSSTWSFNKGGLYTLHLQGENYCLDSLSFEVVVDTLAPVLNLTGDSITCTRRTVVLTGRSADPKANFTWFDPIGNSFNQNIISTTLPGVYKLAVIGDNACTDTVTYIVHADTLSPTINLFADTINCFKPSVILRHDGDSTQITFQWTGPLGFNSSVSNPIITSSGRYQLEAKGKNECITNKIVDIAQDLLTPVLTGSDDTLRCTMDSIRVNAMASNVIGNFIWTGPGGFSSALQNPFVKTPGSYRLIGNNPNGCADTLDINIIPDLGKPDLFVATDTLDCLQTSLTLSAISSQDSLSYLWIDPSGAMTSQKDLNIQRGGTYQIRVTNGSGCYTELDLNIVQDTIHPQFQLTGDSLNCLVRSASLFFNSIENPNSIQWRGPAGFNSNQASPIVSNGGWYVLRLTNDNFCNREDSIFIHQDTLTPTLQITTDTITCLQRQITLTSQSNAQNAIYTWTRPDGSTHNQSNLSTNVGGAFNLTVSGANHCTATQNVIVPVDTISPSVSVLDDTLTCIKINTRLQVQSQQGTYQFEWTGPNGFNSIARNPLIQTAGRYFLKVISSNGCESSQGLTIFADTIHPQINTRADSIQCKKPEAEISVSGTKASDLIVWQDAQGMQISNATNLLVSSGGRYRVQVTNTINGCISLRDVFVLEDTNLIKDIILQAQNPKCGESQGSLQVLGLVGGHGGYQYSLDGINYTSNPDFRSLTPGQYQLFVKDAAGCEFIKPFELIKLPEVVTDISPILELELGEQEQLNLSINLDPTRIMSIHWAPSVGLSCTNCQNPIANPLETTDYIVTVIDENGCQSVSRIRVIVKTPKIFVPNVFSPNGDVLNDLVWVHGPENEVIEIRQFSIFDRWGNQVFMNQNFYPNQADQGWDGTFKGTKCLPGVYVYYVKAETINGKFLTLEEDITLTR
ncbi:MAG: gliding motility-associated C-terminal domain-containing protein [Saprospiraceae bacterium]|nr:gliding motility-associated C-terminal domain-containing protein [Saprospiraceae bacterium]